MFYVTSLHVFNVATICTAVCEDRHILGLTGPISASAPAAGRAAGKISQQEKGSPSSSTQQTRGRLGMASFRIPKPRGIF